MCVPYRKRVSLAWYTHALPALLSTLPYYQLPTPNGMFPGSVVTPSAPSAHLEEEDGEDQVVKVRGVCCLVVSASLVS